MFYSARAPMRYISRDAHKMQEKNVMMDDRFKIFHFSVPLPADRKDPEFPKCPKCCAAFFLSGAPGGQGNLGEQDLLLPTHSSSGASSLRMSTSGMHLAEFAV